MTGQTQAPGPEDEGPSRMSGRSAFMALGIAAAIMGAPPMGRRVRSTGNARVDADLDRVLANRERLIADEARRAAAAVKRARKDAKRKRDHAR